MSETLLDKPIIRMPAFAPGTWLNTPRPLTQSQLRGSVVLVDFWDYTCVNCIRTLPYLKAWHERYADLGLTIVGVHAPEFAVGKLKEQVRAAIREFSLPYPVLLDNDYETWERFANKAWPSKHLVDASGYVRLRRQGEGFYREIESGIRTLLRERDRNVTLPDPLPHLRAEDTPGTVCYRPTPELHAGYRGGGLYGGALGNGEGYVTGGPMVYALPPPSARREGAFYLEGFWRGEPEAMVYAGQSGGRVLVPYRAASVNVVLSPSADPVELILGLRQTNKAVVVEVRQDGIALSAENKGEDVVLSADGRSYVHLERAHMVRLIRNGAFEHHELALTFNAPGVALYAFSFTGCAAPSSGTAPGETFTVR